MRNPHRATDMVWSTIKKWCLEEREAFRSLALLLYLIPSYIHSPMGTRLQLSLIDDVVTL
ncbi:MAG: hypothetical protein NTZ38_00020 [Candidatus Taylorbacteria bacterium]|nr:hypothetical protein [Candidatus Taylorbacteria bacterium]